MSYHLYPSDFRWYFPDAKRPDAEKMLLTGENQNGAFLIRKSETQKGEHSLSGEQRNQIDIAFSISKPRLITAHSYLVLYRRFVLFTSCSFAQLQPHT